MSWGFERGKIYNRKQDIHAKFGGQEQGGIISPRQHNIVIIITGPKGRAHGYADRERADGVFEYFGAGREGDMQMTDRNKAIFEHSKKSKSLLAFEEAGKNLRFKGEYVLEPHHILRVSDGGPDDIHHVIALCPNCHRRAHHGADATTFNNSLIEKMKEIEPN